MCPTGALHRRCRTCWAARSNAAFWRGRRCFQWCVRASSWRWPCRARVARPLLPEVPTVAESGYPGFDATFSLVLFAPIGVPAATVDKMQAALAAALKQPDVVERLRQSDQQVVADPPAASASGGGFEDLGRSRPQD